MKNIVVFSGAGISAESGLGTFRDSGGLWDNYKIEDVATPDAFKKNPELERSGFAGLFSASLELSKNGVLSIMQKKAFDKLFIKEKKL